MSGRIIRIKRGLNEIAKDSIIVSSAPKRQATMNALNSELGKMTLSGGATSASPDLRLYKYKRMDSTTDSDYEQWKQRNPLSTTVKPSSSLHISRCKDGADLLEFDKVNLALCEQCMMDISSQGKASPPLLDPLLEAFQKGMDVDYRCRQPGRFQGYSFLALLIQIRDYETAYHFMVDYKPNCFLEVAPGVTPASIFWNDLTNGNALYSEYADKLYQEIKKQSEKETENSQDALQTGDTYDYYMCVGEVPEGETDGEFVSLAELERMKNLEVFGCDEFVDERALEESEEASDDEDSNAEGYWEDRMMDSTDWEDENWDCYDEDSSSYGDDLHYDDDYRQSDNWDDEYYQNDWDY